MSSKPITVNLREYALQAVHRDDYMAGLSYDLDRIADRIDAEHERMMADRVEVVRCADCAYCQRHLDGSHVCELTHLAHRADYYCYFGARREVDE